MKTIYWLKSGFMFALLVVFCCSLFTFCFADTQTTTINTNTFINAIIDNKTSLYQADSALVTVISPTYEKIIDQQPAQQFETGFFYYNFTPNTTGTYIVYWSAIKNGNTISVGANVLTVQQGSETMALAEVFAIFFVIAVMTYYSFTLDKEHQILKLLLQIVSFALLILLAFSCYDSQNIAGQILFYVMCTLFGLYFSYIGIYFAVTSLKWLYKTGTLK